MESAAKLDDIVYTQKHSLFVPKLEDMVPVIETHLKTQFADVKVSVEKYPDLTKWGFVKPEVGELANMAIVKARNTAFSLGQVGDALDMPNPCAWHLCHAIAYNG